MDRYRKGLWGEGRAALYLTLHGTRIIASRYHTPHGEIDLIGLEGDTLVFVEVKSRPKGQPGDGLAAVSPRKMACIQYAAQYYLRSHPHESIRFDVVEITGAGVRRYQNAF